jgi:hypothetical protein
MVQVRRIDLMLLALACATPYAASAEAQFVFANPPEAGGVAWASTAQAGLATVAGNTRSLGISCEGKLSRTDPRYRVSGGVEFALARSRIDVAEDRNGIAGVGPGELRTIEATTRRAWSLRARLDRFLPRRTGAFAAVRIGGDHPAGKQLLASGQAGFGVDVARARRHELRLELGYDFTYEHQVALEAPLQIHSARAFAGYAAHLDEKTAADLTTEVLANLNREGGIAGSVGAFGDTRVTTSASVRYALNGKLSLAVRATAAYDAAPSTRPAPPGSSFEPGFAPAASRWDGTVDLLAIMNLF